MITQNLDLLKIIPSGSDCSQQTIKIAGCDANGNESSAFEDIENPYSTVVLTSLLYH